LAPLAAEGLVQVGITLTTLDENLSRRLEPRAAGPKRRLRTIRSLHEAGIPVAVSLSPVIPALTDHELERILAAAQAAGAIGAHYGLLRLPHELTEVFTAWLETHVPDRAGHVLSLLRQMHGGAVYRAEFGVRRRGTGAFADLIAQRFKIAARRLGLDAPLPPLDIRRFRPPRLDGQLDLFGAP
jgi:DNA repair photolyase